MCSAPKPPPPQAPPAPTPVRSQEITARQEMQSSAQRGARSGYSSTLLSNPAQSEDGSAGKPVLGR